MERLEETLRRWDGKSVDAITQIYATFATDPGFADRLIAFSVDRPLETGATWLLKHHVEEAATDLDAASTRSLLSILPCLAGWEAKLHCLQILPKLTMPRESAELVFRFLLACREDQNKFIRAWAYSGLHHLAVLHPEYRTEVRELLEHAGRTEQAASVKVRLRRALQQGFPELPD